jgi:hypothetical protein
MQKFTNNISVIYLDDGIDASKYLDVREYRLMTNEEIDRHENPEKYLSDEEKAQLNRERMPTLTPIEFDIKLNNAGLYDAVQDLIKDSFELRIAYNRATFFSRTASFVDQARIALNLTDEQVDAMWEQAITL